MKLIDQADSLKPPRGDRRLKAIAVLPSLATLGNLLCGMGAVYLCVLSADWRGGDLAKQTLNNPRIEQWFPTYLAIAAYLLLAAMVFDVLDGRLARLARKTSDFGAQLDSLSDMVSFGLAPALLVICVVRPVFGGADLDGFARIWWRAQWVMSAVYVCCAAIRLARFNVEHVADEWAHRHFRGLPSPGAAAAVVSIIILHEDYIRIETPYLSVLVQQLSAPLTLLVGVLMVSRFRYPHFVNTMLRGRRPPSQVLAIAGLLLASAIIHPRLTFVVLSLGYALMGPIDAVWRRTTGGQDHGSKSRQGATRSRREAGEGTAAGGAGPISTADRAG